MKNASLNHQFYTCPMHPEIRQRGPGRCPLCGMALVPVKRKRGPAAAKPAAPRAGAFDKHAGHQTAAFLAKFWVALVLTLPLIAFSELPERLLGLRLPVFPVSRYLALVLGSAVYFYCGWVFLAGGRLIGSIALADIIREESREVIDSLKRLGVKVSMITGDSDDVASWVSKELGLDEYFAKVLPDEKADKVKALQKRGLKVAMVGDGVNDAPALTQADLGIAIGAGYNLVALPLAAGALASRGVILQPAVAAIFMSLITVIVAVNALLLRGKRL